MRYKTIREATEAWVREFSAIPTCMIEKLIRIGDEDITEVTVPCRGERVYVYDLPEGCTTHEGEIEKVLADADVWLINLDNGTTVEVGRDDFEPENYGGLPAWGYMWQFKERIDDWWVEEDEGVRKLSECGFRVYESQEFGFFFGIDSGGYDFYEAHWIPLYHARGLRWADEQYETEV